VSARRLPWLFVLLVGLATGTSHAAPQVSPRLLPRPADGDGLKVGQNSRFHAGLGLGAGFDSNVFYEHKVEKPARAAFLVTTGWLGIGNRETRDGSMMSPPERTDRAIDYNISAIVGVRQFLDGRQKVVRQSRFSLGTEAHVAVLPGRRFSVELDQWFFRIAEPRNVQAGAEYNFNRIESDTALRFALRPGGGRLSMTTGYLGQVLWFQESDPDVARANRTVNGALGEIKWRLLPTSAFFTRYTMHHTYYLSCCSQPGTGRNEDNFAHRLVGGFQGQVLKRVVLGAEAGWGWAFYRQDVSGPNFKGPIARVSFDYFPTLRTRLNLSFSRWFQDSLYGNYLVDTGGRAFVSHTWRWRMVTDVGAGLFAREYRGLPTPGSEDAAVAGYSGVFETLERRDLLATVMFKLEQPLGRFFVITALYDLYIDRTKFTVTFTDGTVNDAGYIRHLAMAYGSVRF
jgi:hypothetical protein